MGNYIYLFSSRYTQPLQCCLYIFLYSTDTFFAKVLISTLFKIIKCNLFISSGNLLYDFMSILKMHI
jgi:hypothetical protein